MNFTNIRTIYLEIHPLQREAIKHLVDEVERGRRARWQVEALVTFIANCMTMAGDDHVTINAKVIRDQFGNLSISRLVEAGLIERANRYRPGRNAYGYKMTVKLAAAWYPAWQTAIRRPLNEFVILNGPTPSKKPQMAVPYREPLTSEHFWALIDRSVDVPLRKSMTCLDDPVVIQAVEEYIEKLNKIAHPLNVEHLEKTRDFGLDLMQKNKRLTKKWYKGQAYATASRMILNRTVDGIFYPQMTWSEGRVYDSGIQLLSKHFDKDRILGPDQKNFDLKAAHVAITKKLFNDQGLDSTFLEGYVEEKTEMAEALGLDIDVFKTSFLGLLNGASLDIDHNGENTILRAFRNKYGPYFFSNMKTFALPFLELRDNIQKLSKQAEDMGATRRPGTNIGYIATVLEFVAKALVIKENDLCLLGDQHDGLIIKSKDHGPQLSTTWIEKHLGITMEMIEKPLGDTRDVEIQEIQEEPEGAFLGFSL